MLCFLSYQLQSLPAQPHYLDGFEVLYRSLLPASSDWAAKKVTLPSFQTQVGPLKRGYKYEFKVRPYGSNLYGRESNTRHLRVPETGNTRLFVSFLLLWNNLVCFTELEYTSKPRLKDNNNNNTKLDALYTVPSASPLTVSITVSHEQNNTIHLSWDPPPHDTHNGIIQGYKVIPGVSWHSNVVSPPEQSRHY